MEGRTGLNAWSFTFDSTAYGSGTHTIVTRLVSDGLVLQYRVVSVKIT